MNTKLSCSAGNCVHNINSLCTAREIRVEGVMASTSNSTQCGTFAERGLKNALANLANMNVVGEIKQVFSRNESIEMSPKVMCVAENCTYNVDKFCNADNVQINGATARHSASTECETFIQG